MVSALDVGQKLLNLGKAQNERITPMALIKFVYICHGWMMAIHGCPLFGERVEAWPYGPVIPKLYNKVKKYRGNPVEDIVRGVLPAFSDEEESIIEQVFKVYPNDGIILSGLTHQPGTPWSQTKEIGETHIPNELIMHHFKEMMAQSQADA